MKKEYNALLLLFVAALSARLLFFDTSFFFWDESVYLLHGQAFSGLQPAYSELSLRPPLLPFLLAPFARLPFYEAASKLLVAFLNSLVVIPLFYMAKAAFGRRSALVAASIAALLPLHVLNSRWIMTDALASLLMLSSVAAYFYACRKGKLWLFVAGGVFASLAVLMKFTSLLLAVLLLPIFVASLRKGIWRRWLLSFLVAFMVVLPFLIASAVYFSSPFAVLLTAFRVVSQAGNVSFGFLAQLIVDSLGFLLLFLPFGFFALREAKPAKAYLLFCVAVTFASSFAILNKDVVKPLGIEWEAGRFMLLPVLFSIPFIAKGVELSFSFLKSASAHSRLKAASIVLLAVLLSVVAFAFDSRFSLLPQLERAYEPSVSHESGFRQVAKDAGLHLSDMGVSSFSCIGNCPPVAYYSGKKMSLFFSMGSLLGSSDEVIVAFDNNAYELAHYKLEAKFCSSLHCSYVFRR